ncbi:MAG: AIR synthase-related protein, partial [bacterium]
IVINEESVPVLEPVKAFCDLLGFTPYELANEGKVVLAVAPEYAGMVIKLMRSHALGKNSAVIGYADDKGVFPAILKTALGANNILEMPRGENLPRIC